jgi:KTSC domain
MQRRPVNSSNLAAVGWEAADENSPDIGEMEVEFRNGFVYRYEGVPRSEYENLLGASSPGRYLNQNIIGVYDERRV